MSRFFAQYQNSDYKVYATLKGAQGPINSVAISEDGKLLASGGDDEAVCIWDLEEQKIIDTLSDHQRRWGQITCVTWMESPMDAQSICFGTGRGLLLVYTKQKESENFRELDCAHSFVYNDAVEAISYNDQHGKLIVSSQGGKIVMYAMSKSRTLDRIWTKSLGDLENGKLTTPWSVQFTNGGDSIIVCGLESGTIFSKVSTSGADNWSKQLKSSIGSARLSPNGSYLLVDNMTKGFDVYTYPTLTLSESFEIQRAQTYLLEGVFSEGSLVISCGSDHGQVYVFSCKTSLCVQKLRVGSRNSMIQAMDAVSSGRFHFLAAGTSDDKPEIVVWRKMVKSSRGRPSPNPGCNPLIMVLFLNGILLIAIFGVLTSKLDMGAWNINNLAPLHRLVNTNNPEAAYPREAPNAKVSNVKVVEPVFAHGEASNAKVAEPVFAHGEASNAKVVEPVFAHEEASNPKVVEPVFVHVSSKDHTKQDHTKPNRKGNKALEHFGNNMLKQGNNVNSPGRKKRMAEDL